MQNKYYVNNSQVIYNVFYSKFLLVALISAEHRVINFIAIGLQRYKIFKITRVSFLAHIVYSVDYPLV